MKKLLVIAALWFATAGVAGNALAADKAADKKDTSTTAKTTTTTKDAAPKAGALMVNINTAGKDDLKALKGIGDTRAQDIIDYRTKNGNFKTVDDLEKVKGIGPGTMKQIRANITVSGETMIPKKAESTAKSSSSTTSKDTKSTSTASTDSKAKK